MEAQALVGGGQGRLQEEALYWAPTNFLKFYLKHLYATFQGPQGGEHKTYQHI